MEHLKHENLLSHKKIRKEIIVFCNIETEKSRFYHNQNLILLKDVVSDKMLISKLVSSGVKIINTLLATKMMITKLNN